MNHAQLWRVGQYANQSEDLNYSLYRWQGSRSIMTTTLESMLGMDMDLVLNKQLQSAEDDKIAFPDLACDVANIVIAFRTAPTLPRDMVLWRAMSRTDNIPMPDTSLWMSTSATIEGAQNWANFNLTNGECNIFKLIVKSDGIKALAVGGMNDDDLDNEEEILTCFNFKLKLVEDETFTSNNNPIKVFHVV
jgi:hypothetical protein